MTPDEKYQIERELDRQRAREFRAALIRAGRLRPRSDVTPGGGNGQPFLSIERPDPAASGVAGVGAAGVMIAGVR